MVQPNLDINDLTKWIHLKVTIIGSLSQIALYPKTNI